MAVYSAESLTTLRMPRARDASEELGRSLGSAKEGDYVHTHCTRHTKSSTEGSTNARSRVQNSLTGLESVVSWASRPVYLARLLLLQGKVRLHPGAIKRKKED